MVPKCLRSTQQASINLNVADSSLRRKTGLLNKMVIQAILSVLENLAWLKSEPTVGQGRSVPTAPNTSLLPTIFSELDSYSNP